MGQNIRRRSSVPILVLSVREDESDKVAALDLGADDYLTKPFGVEEPMAQIRRLLRRAEAQDGDRPVRYRTDDLEIDLGARRVVRGGEEVRLTKTEWGLLEALSAHPGKLLTHRWAAGVSVGTRLCGGRRRAPRVHEPSPPEDRRGSGKATDHRHGPGHRLEVASSNDRGSEDLTLQSPQRLAFWLASGRLSR